jgi:predicted RNA binding protein YcfA (HicA-like mRNA interferase family)
MPKLKNLSGEEIIKIFKIFGFIIAKQKGSHIKLIRLLQDNIKQPITIPNHKEIDKGTLKAIIRQASKYISEDDLKNHFYAK